MRTTVVVVVGIAGSGKSTQASRIGQRFAAGVSSGGGWLRARAARGHAAARAQLDSGKLMSSAVLHEFLTDEVGPVVGDGDIHVVEGIPRSPGQVEQLCDWFAGVAVPTDVVGLHLDVPVECARARLLRRNHTRTDDSPAVIHQRLIRDATQQTVTLASLAQRWPLLSVDGTPMADAVAFDISQRLRAYLPCPGRPSHTSR